MKIQKLICIDEEIAHFLKKEENASKLINDLLTEYFNKNVIEQMSAEQLRKKIAYEKQKIEIQKKFDEELRALENGI